MLKTRVKPELTIRLVAVSPEWKALGQLPAFTTASRYEAFVWDLSQTARRIFGSTILILKLLENAETSRTYLAEVPPHIELQPWRGTLPDPDRLQPYERSGGHRADLRWARDQLAARGIAPVELPVQEQLSEKSSVWRIPTNRGQYWLKSAARWLLPEGPVLECLSEFNVPRVVAHEQHRTLMEDAGLARFEGGNFDQRQAMIVELARLQMATRQVIPQLLSAGVPDWRPPSVIPRLLEAVAAGYDRCSADERDALLHFEKSISDRFRRLQECGFDDTLVHGDASFSNFLGRPGAATICDFAECGIGHPAFDAYKLSQHVLSRDMEHLWIKTWRRIFPHSDPATALAVGHPLYMAKNAAFYASPETRPNSPSALEWLRILAFMVELERSGRVLW